MSYPSRRQEWMNMKKINILKTNKCQFGYIKRQKKLHLIITIIGLSIIAIIFIAGMIIYGSKNNNLTILASLCALPFAKTASDLIMFLPHKSASKEIFDSVEQRNKYYITNYDCIFTSKEHAMPIKAVINTDNAIFAYTDSVKVEPEHFELTLKTFQKKAGNNITVTLYKDKNKFLKKIEYLNSAKYNELTKESKEDMEKINKSMKAMCL